MTVLATMNETIVHLPTLSAFCLKRQCDARALIEAATPGLSLHITPETEGSFVEEVAELSQTESQQSHNEIVLLLPDCLCFL